MLQQFLKIFLTILLVVDPAGLMPVFISLTGGMQGKRRGRVMRTALLAAFLILVFFIVVGAPLLGFLGISPGAFYVSGGALLFLVSVDMLYGKPRRSQVESDPNEAGPPTDEASGPAIFPLAIPMLSGPGAITAVMLFMSGPADPLATGAMLIVSVALTLGLAAGAMTLSGWALKILGKTGILVLERIMGLLLAGLSVQFAYEGLLRLGFVTAVRG
jgi:multiple antibiotic resistance protein